MADVADTVRRAPMAIVGLSCRFAGAADYRAFWQNIMDGRASLTPLGKDAALPFGTRPLFGCPYPTVAGQLGRLYACTPAQVHLPHQMNKGENPDLYFAIQLAHDALADAGCLPRAGQSLRGTVRFAYAPIFNVSSINWLQHTFFIDQTMELLRRLNPKALPESLEQVHASLLESLPEPNADSFAAAAGHRVADGIARACAFTGAATAVDAGVLSATSALEQAIDDLDAGRADVALVGALMPPLATALLQGLSGHVAFSDARELIPFAREARGTVPGEGGAFFVLKRRRDALAAKDRIYALVSGAVSGLAGVDELLPAALREASRPGEAQLPVSAVQLVEADGRGEPAADAAEAEALVKLWGVHKAGDPLVGVGSVKGNVGHCLWAAGAAGLAKAALALHYRVLPPQIATDLPLECLARVDSGAYLLAAPRPWIVGDRAKARRAAVLARDFTGRGAAVILEEEPEKRI